MTIKVIKKGDKDKQGNAVCPKCGERVLIEKHFGDPPSCPSCGIPYSPNYGPPSYH